jgi:hypothetical protein
MRDVNQPVGYKIWAVDDVVYGPVELPMLVDWVKDQRVLAGTWVFSEAADAWHKAGTLPELQLFFRKATPAGAASPGTPGAPEASPLVAGIRPGVLRRVKIFADMSDQQLGRFVQFMEVVKVRQWTEVVKQGSHGDAMYLVLEGELRVRMMIGSKETILVTLPAGEFFGEISLFDQGPRSADVVANLDSVLLRISADAFQRLVREAPEISAPFLFAIAKTLTSRIRADDKRYRDSINFARSASAAK